MSFSAGGTGPLATYRDGGADFTLTWPAPLPADVVSEDSVTYPEVHPGVDLVVPAVPGGFSHVLVVKNAEAAANPEVRETAYAIGGSATVTETNCWPREVIRIGSNFEAPATSGALTCSSTSPRSRASGSSRRPASTRT